MECFFLAAKVELNQIIKNYINLITRVIINLMSLFEKKALYLNLVTFRKLVDIKRFCSRIIREKIKNNKPNCDEQLTFALISDK